MSSPCEEFTVRCPECQAEYTTWWRRSMNISLDQFSRKYVRKMSSGRCPICYTVVDLRSLVVEWGER